MDSFPPPQTAVWSCGRIDGTLGAVAWSTFPLLNSSKFQLLGHLNA